MIKLAATGTIDFLKDGRRKYYFVRADVKDLKAWRISKLEPDGD